MKKKYIESAQAALCTTILQSTWSAITTNQLQKFLMNGILDSDSSIVHAPPPSLLRATPRRKAIFHIIYYVMARVL